MREERLLQERINLLRKELATLTEKLDEIAVALEEVEDLRREIKGLKLFLGRAHPDFKKEFPGIMQKVFKKT